MDQKRMGVWWLVAAAVVTVSLWRVPFGGQFLYPFTMLAIWFHEMGHGLTAMFLGGNFEKLLLYANGSGVAFYSGSVFGGPFGRALVSAGGLMGPSVAGFLLILSSRRFKTAQIGLWLLGLALILSALIWVRTLFGVAFTLLAGAAILVAARKTSKEVQGFLVQFLGVQASISCFRQLDYLFTHTVTIGGKEMLSDSARIGATLILPYWFWGIVLAGTSLGLLVLGLYLAYRTAY